MCNIVQLFFSFFFEIGVRARASSTPQSDRSRQKSVLTHYQKAQSASKSVESFFAKQGRESEGKKRQRKKKKWKSG